VHLHACSIDFEEIMSFSHWFTVAALALLPAMLPPAASAQQPLQQPDPADANAPVPASGYVSAFKNYRAAADEKASPDKVWRAANEEVQSQGEHAGHMKDPGPGNASPATKADALEGQQGQQRQAAPQADPHAGHDSKGK
jgi:hypothetical protein